MVRWILEKIGKKMKRKGGERNLLGYLVGWICGRKTSGTQVFSLQTHQNVFFPNLRENWRKNTMPAKDQIYPSLSIMFVLWVMFTLCVFFFFSDFPSSFSIFLLFYHFNQKERHVLLNFFSFFFLEIKDGTFY